MWSWLDPWERGPGLRSQKKAVSEEVLSALEAEAVFQGVLSALEAEAALQGVVPAAEAEATKPQE